MDAEQTERLASVRPTESLRPVDAALLRAWTALRDGRVADAEDHLRLLVGTEAGAASGNVRTSGEESWARVLRGLVLESRGRLGDAERWFDQAANAEATSSDADPRLGALAWECLGRVRRRMDDPIRALDAHRRSLEIRERVGSWEECRRSAHELALDATVAGNHEDAITWHRRATELAAAMGDAGSLLRAESLSHLARAQRAARRLHEALHSAQQSRDLRVRLDPSSLETLQASVDVLEYRLAIAAEGTHAAPSPNTNSATSSVGRPLDAILAALGDLRRECLAWGDRAADVLGRCDEATDFARRLEAASPEP